jgi:hypothetical protein
MTHFSHSTRQKRFCFFYNRKMTRLFVQYQKNAPVTIFTQNLIIPQGEVPVVADLVAACTSDQTRGLLGLPTDYGPLTLNLPNSVTRSASAEDCFATTDLTGTTLRPGLPLTQLNGLGLDDLQPLIIRSMDLPVAGELELDSLTFVNQTAIPVTVDDFLDWLCGSNTNSAAYLIENEIMSQEQIQSDFPIEFPLAGREESLKLLSSIFLTSFRQRANGDRNSRQIPVCTGLPGLGKTRLLNECATTVFDMCKMQGKRLSAIVSFGNDGCAYSKLDNALGISCSFAWRVLHLFFKAQHSFQDWMCEKSPKNRRHLTLHLVLSIIERHWRQKTDGDILVFVGIDEYQKLSQLELSALLDTLCDSSLRSPKSKLSFFCMLAGTDLNMTRVARTSHPNTERIPIRFLTHAESIKAIGPFISKTHPGFVVSEAFSQNVFHLGGVPRLLTAFAKRVTYLDRADLVESRLRAARRAVLSNAYFSPLSLSDLLTLLAISFTNTPVLNVQACPFIDSSQAAARELTWSQIIANGMCVLQEDNRVVVPFHLVHQVLERRLLESDPLNQFQKALISSLLGLSFDVEDPISNVPSWLSWEAFGANFYCIRINSFLVLGVSTLPLSYLLRGSQFSSNIFQVLVDIRVAKVFPSNEQYGPHLPQKLTQRKAGYISVDWFQGETLQVVLNGEDGAGADIFFILKHADDKGYIIVLDQRKRLGSHITDSTLAAFKSKLPDAPSFLQEFNLSTVFGLTSIYSQISIAPIPDSAFFVSVQDSLHFHGTLFDHPGCSMAIDVNSALKTSVGQIFRGSKRKRMELAARVIQHRTENRIGNYDELLLLVSGWKEEMDESACARLKFS